MKLNWGKPIGGKKAKAKGNVLLWGESFPGADQIANTLGFESEREFMDHINNLPTEYEFVYLGKEWPLPMQGSELESNRYQLEAYHGTPHEVDKFSVDRIGTGEGNQAFGWGLYFSNEKEIGEHYALDLSRIDPNKAKYKGKSINELYDTAMENMRNNPKNSKANAGAVFWEDLAVGTHPKTAMNGLKDHPGYESFKKTIDISKFKNVEAGNLYSVTIHKGKTPEQYTYMKWEDPVSETEINAIKKQAKKENLKDRWGRSVNDLGYYPNSIPFSKNQTGMVTYNQLKSEFNLSPKEASLFLLRSGIDGIKFDAGSLSGVKDSKAENYVVFDDKAITIENKNRYQLEDIIEQSPDKEIYKEILKDPKVSQGNLERKDFRRATKKLFADALVPISTRLGKIDPMLKAKARALDFDIMTTQKKYQDKILPYLQAVEKMGREERAVFEMAELNRDQATVQAIVKQKGMENAYEAKKKALHEIYQEAINSGVDIGYLENYHPRKIKYTDDLLKKLYGADYGTLLKQIDDALMKHGGIQTKNMTPEAIDHVMNQLVMGKNVSGVKLSRPGNAKNRKIDVLDKDLRQFYMDSNSSLIFYINGLVNHIGTRKFFGKHLNQQNGVVDLEVSIGTFVREIGKSKNFTNDEMIELTSVLADRFSPKQNTSKITRSYRDFMYLNTMGTAWPLSAITQLGDFSSSIHHLGKEGEKGSWIPLRGIIKTLQSLASKNKISMDDMAITNQSMEHAETSGLSKMVNLSFKLIGLTIMDKIGKETFINGTLRKYQDMAGDPKRAKTLFDYMDKVFPNDKIKTEVLNDLKFGNNSHNVKFLLMYDLLDYQPLTKSEVPAMYHRYNGVGRLAYMLKTWSIRQLDTQRREIFDKIKNGKTPAERAEGFKALVTLTGSLYALQFTADVIKDIIQNRDIDPEDTAWDNLWKLLGASKYIVWQAREEGPHNAAVRMILPPFKIIDELMKDIPNLASGKRKLHEAELVNSIPLIGRNLYWWFGYGKTKNLKNRERRSDRLLTDLRKKAKATPTEMTAEERRALAKLQSYKKAYNDYKKVYELSLENDNELQSEKYLERMNFYLDQMKKITVPGYLEKKFQELIP